MTDAGTGITEGMTEEEIIKHVKKCRRDLAFFAPRFLKVQTTGGDMVPFTLNRPQRLLLHIFDEIRKKRLLRVVILKGRRMGVSTLISAWFYQRTALYPNRYAMQVTHEPQASEFIFKMVKRYYDFCPAAFRPAVRANNARLMEFNNKEGTGLNSAFRVATAGKDDLGSGQLIHFLHLSELAKYPPENTDTLLTSVLQTIPKKSNTAIIFESTAKGIGGEFHDRFWNAKYRVWIKRLSKDGNPIMEETVNPLADELNDYTSVFLPWFVFEDNRMVPPQGFVRTRDEAELAKRYGIDDEQLYWRRYTISNECRGSLETFQQEHPATPEEAFLGTGRPVFDNTKVSLLRDHAPPPIARYEILGGNVIAAAQGRFKVWKEPQPGHAYIIAADVAEGLLKGDASAAVVIDHRSGEQVAEWHGKCDPDEYAQFLLAIGKRYNNALIAPERNNHGLTVVTHLFSAKYPYLYCEMVPDPPGKPRKRYGWQTSSATRPLIIDTLIKEEREGTHGLKSAELFGEMLSFKIQDNGKYEADANRHDDLVIAAAIAKHLRQVTPLPAMRKAKPRDALHAPARRKGGNWA
ncbi:MAG: hypothetical protein P1P84_02720 [Deferrisomatales bacterium]|nr:hypothetical protein [Deferrisomatales bacterium]